MIQLPKCVSAKPTIANINYLNQWSKILWANIKMPFLLVSTNYTSCHMTKFSHSDATFNGIMQSYKRERKILLSCPSHKYVTVSTNIFTSTYGLHYQHTCIHTFLLYASTPCLLNWMVGKVIGSHHWMIQHHPHKKFMLLFLDCLVYFKWNTYLIFNRSCESKY